MVFLKEDINLDELMNWIQFSPIKVNLIFLEGFRDLPYPTILCLKSWDDLEPQLNNRVKMISGLICSQNGYNNKKIRQNIDVVDIHEDFEKFLKIFKLRW